MLIDRMEYASQYGEQLPHLIDAIEFIKRNPDPGEGKHRFPGGYLMCQSGMTKDPEGAYEAHRKYIDIQILKEGSEFLFWNRIERMDVVAEYDETKDKIAIDGEGSLLELKPGMFVVLYPEDAHKACRHPQGGISTAYKKYVVKLEL